MQRLLPILCAVAGLAVGAVAGLFIWSEDSPAPRQAIHAGDPEPAPKAQLQPAAEPRPARPVSMGRLLAGVGVPRPKGDGAISGTVKYDEGGRLADVEVRATPLLPGSDEGDAGDRLEAFALRRAAERALQVTARTGADGSFRLAGLDADKHYSLALTTPGHGFRPESGHGITHYRTGTTVGFIATRRLNLRLKFPDGREPDWAYVEVVPDGKEDRSLHRNWHWTFADPSIPMRPGRWKLTAKAGDWQEFAGEAVHDTAQNAAAELAIDLRQRNGIKGTVVPMIGTVERLQLVMVPETDGKFPEVDRPSGFGGRSTSKLFMTPGNFDFGFFDLEPGRYRLCLFLGDRLLLRHDQAVAGDLTTLRLVVPEPDTKDFIVVRVSGPDGPMESDVEIYLSYAHRNGKSGGGAAVLKRGGGEYWVLRDDERLHQPDGWYELMVDTRKFGRRELRYERGRIDALEVRFDVPTFVVVEISGFEGHAQMKKLRADCFVFNPEGPYPGSLPHYRDHSQAGSTRRLGPLEPGKYVVRLYLDEHGGFSDFVLDSRTLDIIAGENPVVLTAPQTYSITVLVPEEYRKQQVNIEFVEDTRYRQAQRQASVAEIEFHNLKPGEYRLQAIPAGVMKVNIPAMAGQRITFAPQPFNAYRLDMRHPYAQVDVGLASGDLVVEIDGVLLADEFTKRHDLIRAASAKESTTWVVMRAGQRVSVTFDGRKWAQAGLSGMPARVE